MILIINFGDFSCENIRKILEFLELSFMIIDWKLCHYFQENFKIFTHVILTGGPDHIYTYKEKPIIPPWIIEKKCKILAICYGMHAIVYHFKGLVFENKFNQKCITSVTNIITKEKRKVWMNRKDFVFFLPSCFDIIEIDDQTNNIASFISKDHNILALQYHPESINAIDIKLFKLFAEAL